MVNRYALISDGKVVNVVEQTDSPPSEFNPIESDVAQIGDNFDGVEFIKPTLPPKIATPLTTITDLEMEQVRRLTPRAMREFMLAVATLIPSGVPTPPGVVALQTLDAAIRAERAKL